MSGELPLSNNTTSNYRNDKNDDKANDNMPTITKIDQQFPTNNNYTMNSNSIMQDQNYQYPDTTVPNFSYPSNQYLQQQSQLKVDYSLLSPADSLDSNITNVVPPPQEEKKKRHRRKFHEVERIYVCNYKNCIKLYGTLNHLNSHVLTQDHGPKRNTEEFKAIRDLRRRERKRQKQEARRLAEPWNLPPKKKSNPRGATANTMDDQDAPISSASNATNFLISNRMYMNPSMQASNFSYQHSYSAPSSTGSLQYSSIPTAVSNSNMIDNKPLMRYSLSHPPGLQQQQQQQQQSTQPLSTPLTLDNYMRYNSDYSQVTDTYGTRFVPNTNNTSYLTSNYNNNYNNNNLMSSSSLYIPTATSQLQYPQHSPVQASLTGYRPLPLLNDMVPTQMQQPPHHIRLPTLDNHDTEQHESSEYNHYQQLHPQQQLQQLQQLQAFYSQLQKNDAFTLLTHSANQSTQNPTDEKDFQR